MRVTNEMPGTEGLMILLDGEPIGFVVAADDEEGWVDRVMPNEYRAHAGLPLVQDETQPTRQHGKVEFLWPNDIRRSVLPSVSLAPADTPAEKGSKYKSEWKPNSLNEDFWKEVLVGHKIVDITFDEHGISTLKLDSGETVYLPVELKGGRLCIRD